MAHPRHPVEYFGYTGKAMSDTKRQAHSKIVAMVLKTRGPQSETGIKDKNAANGS